MLVTADEWSLVSRGSGSRPGKLEIQLYNRGEDAHDLAARRLDGSGDVPPRRDAAGAARRGGVAAQARSLPAVVHLPGHRAAGMRAALRFVRR